MKTLTGDKNQCPSCGEFFNSTYAFEKHRAGTIGIDRRCRTPDEMRELGMDINSRGFWVGEVWDKAALSLVREAKQTFSEGGEGVDGTDTNKG